MSIWAHRFFCLDSACFSFFSVGLLLSERNLPTQRSVSAAQREAWAPNYQLTAPYLTSPLHSPQPTAYFQQPTLLTAYYQQPETTDPSIVCIPGCAVDGGRGNPLHWGTPARRGFCSFVEGRSQLPKASVHLLRVLRCFHRQKGLIPVSRDSSSARLHWFQWFPCLFFHIPCFRVSVFPCFHGTGPLLPKVVESQRNPGKNRSPKTNIPVDDSTGVKSGTLSSCLTCKRSPVERLIT